MPVSAEGRVEHQKINQTAALLSFAWFFGWQLDLLEKLGGTCTTCLAILNKISVFLFQHFFSARWKKKKNWPQIRLFFVILWIKYYFLVNRKIVSHCNLYEIAHSFRGLSSKPVEISFIFSFSLMFCKISKVHRFLLARGMKQRDYFFFLPHLIEQQKKLHLPTYFLKNRQDVMCHPWNKKTKYLYSEPKKNVFTYFCPEVFKGH